MFIMVLNYRFSIVVNLNHEIDMSIEKPSPDIEFLSELSILERAFESLPPELEITVRDPQVGVEGYVVVWNTMLAKDGPLGRCGKGGTRITPNTSASEVRMLAKIMALKNAAAGLPLGGAKSGMRDNPDSPGFERRYRRFVELVRPILRENGGIFGGLGFDIGARPDHPYWACDQLKSTKSFTGKPIEMGGTDYDQEGIAGLGVAVAARSAMTVCGEGIAGKRFAVQGVGAMGAAVIRYLTEFGAHLSHVSDPRLGGCYQLAGELDARLLNFLIKQQFEQAKELLTLDRYPKFDQDEVLYQETDVLLPCAVQDVVTVFNANRIRAKYLVEGANNPCSPEARSLLHGSGTLVIPDFIANPGGIIAAFIEMTSATTPEENVVTREKVRQAKDLTIRKISDNVVQIIALAREYGVEPVQTGRYLALSRIVG
jgi:glutamate dehydrogenase (NAD(P)+)